MRPKDSWQHILLSSHFTPPVLETFSYQKSNEFLLHLWSLVNLILNWVASCLGFEILHPLIIIRWKINSLPEGTNLIIILKLTLCAELFRCRNRWGAPVFGWRGTAGSGVTVCTGLVGFVANFFNVTIRFSHISVTSSIRCRTYSVKQEQKINEFARWLVEIGLCKYMR